MTAVWWALVGHLVLAPMLALSVPPWAGLIMLLIRVVLALVFMLVIVTGVWNGLSRWRRPSASAYHPLTECLMPLLVVGLGLLLICSTDRGSVDTLFQQVDRVLMNGRFAPPATAPAGASWYDVLSVMETASPTPESKDNKSGQE